MGWPTLVIANLTFFATSPKVVASMLWDYKAMHWTLRTHVACKLSTNYKYLIKSSREEIYLGAYACMYLYETSLDPHSSSPVRYIDIEYRLSIYRHFWKISISIWSFLKISISISISIRQFWKISISIRQFWKYRYR